jgi:ATP-dependent DNA helicase RecQ
VDTEAIHVKAHEILKRLYGSNAAFREGQYEAVEATLTKKRTLVVQKTGWGKSLLYFISTRILRDEGAGPTMVVSPLLVLMRNQIEAAEKLGLVCDAFNSENKDRHGEILDAIRRNEIDLLLITPESLFSKGNRGFQSAINETSVGMFVIDEAHCISDWGHDFRLEYSNLYKFIEKLPFNIPLLATTATANDRVVQDLEKQLSGDDGNPIFVLRGPLTRESLSIQILKLESKPDRYAWILENIGKLPGSGIIYCLTRRDCDYLADYLSGNGVAAMPYYSGNREELSARNSKAEELFLNNKIKALVATVKLGMGYDKPDIGFVIHFQQPGNVVAYYQQIGRAGRAIDRAYVFLMTGKEDDDILDYFINTAFPNEANQNQIISEIEKDNGLSQRRLSWRINLRGNVLEKGLSFLEHEGFVYRDENNRYFLTGRKFKFNAEHYERIREQRFREKKQIKDFINTDACYSKYIVNCLDDMTAAECGTCSNCTGHPILDTIVSPSRENEEKSLEYLNAIRIPIEDRKQWPSKEFVMAEMLENGVKIVPHVNVEGIALARYGDAGYGALVKEDKYSASAFRDELIGKSAEVLRPYVKEHGVAALTCVPSLRNDKVKIFAKRLAEALRVPFADLLGKKSAPQQKRMENSAYQCANAIHSFFLMDGAHIPKKIILVDDVVDSRWTLTVCGYLLGKSGCEWVFPFALADSSEQRNTAEGK